MSGIWWYVAGLLTPLALFVVVLVAGLITGDTKVTTTRRVNGEIVERKVWPR